MKTKRILIAAGMLLLILALLFCLLVPYSSNASAVPLSEIPSDYRNTVVPSDTYCDTVYMVENRYILRKTQTFYVIPAALADLDDVGTAGTSYWQFTLYVSSPTRYPARLKDLQLDVEADHNTVFTNMIGPGTGQLNNQLTIPQKEMNLSGENVYRATLHVATKNSYLSANEECQAQFRWSGTISLGTFMPDLAFEINGSQSYMGNVKN